MLSLTCSGKYQDDAGSHDQSLLLSMMKGDVKSAIEAAADKEQLTDWHLNLAASGQCSKKESRGGLR